MHIYIHVRVYMGRTQPCYKRNDLIVHLFVQKAESRGLVVDAHGVR